MDRMDRIEIYYRILQNQELEESRKREQKRYDDRVYGNWKRLVRALLIRERLKIKYNYFGGDEGQSTSKTTDSKK